VTELEIIELYQNRDEAAIEECKLKYGKLLMKISYGVLGNDEDSQECVADTYMKAWDSIPPQEPKNLMAYLGRIVRNISINRYNENRAKKRGGDFILTELTDCIPSVDTVETSLESSELSNVIVNWLRSLEKEERVLFTRRYWFGEPLESLAQENHTSANKLAGRMFRLRQKLRETLEKEGIEI
jgi:RNA polymerase sigma-70 factor (ECF subfamily)